MKQPKVKFFGEECEVFEIEWNSKGKLIKLRFYYRDVRTTLFQNETAKRLIQDDYMGYFLAPSLEEFVS